MLTIIIAQRTHLGLITPLMPLIDLAIGVAHCMHRGSIEHLQAAKGWVGISSTSAPPDSYAKTALMQERTLKIHIKWTTSLCIPCQAAMLIPGLIIQEVGKNTLSHHHEVQQPDAPAATPPEPAGSAAITIHKQLMTPPTKLTPLSSSSLHFRQSNHWFLCRFLFVSLQFPSLCSNLLSC
ncbi:hypothetical protein EDD37DRAFT_507058 [Exophiala viscosa]|uniref:uncharacterized protein n=1 Tax=Exophiala viscosa TaxID=2486360 RepID=UPI00219EB2A6|nr:hypothetical protein EDD37DRAFT_507058 [Exophiala viscosa]